MTSQEIEALRRRGRLLLAYGVFILLLDVFYFCFIVPHIILGRVFAIIAAAVVVYHQALIVGQLRRLPR